MSSPPAQLQSWKELANYLGVSVRTVQLWERERALPVHRLPGRRGLVLAIPEEVEQWRNRNPVLPPPAPTPYPILHVLAAFAAGAALTWFLLRPAPLHHYTLDNGVITAFNRSGQVSWTFTTGSFHRASIDNSLAGVIQTDLDGDGEDEIITTVEPHQQNHSIACLNSRGKLLWSRPVGHTVSTATGKSYEAPFKARGIILLNGFPDRVPRILAITFHHLYHPAQLLLLDIKGNVISEYWHSGHITAATLFDFNRDGHPELFALAINQARKAAEFLVLNPFQMSGASTEPEPRYQLEAMPLGVELARAHFTPTAISRIYSEYNVPITVTAKSDSLIVDIQEGTGTGNNGFSIAYEIDRSLRVRSISPSDTFNSNQTVLLREGKIARILTPADLKTLHPLVWLKPWGELSN